MGSYAYRRAFHHDIVIHNDNVCVRQIFPSVSLYRNRSRSSIHFCGRAEPECGQELYQIVCRRLSGGRNHRACLYHLLPFAASPPAVDPNAAPVSMVWSYIGELVFNMLVLVGAVKMADRVVREMMGL